MKKIANVTSTTGYTFEQVSALTNSELMDLICDGSELTVKEVRRMSHTDKVNAYWAMLDVKKLQLIDPRVAELERLKAENAALKAENPTATTKGKLCACGCNGMTKGGTWLPGHDAIHNAKARNNGELKHQPRPCKCGCGEWTKGGQFRPGHDAKYYAKLHASAEIGVKPAFLPTTLSPKEFQLIDPEVKVA